MAESKGTLLARSVQKHAGRAKEKVKMMIKITNLGCATNRTTSSPSVSTTCVVVSESARIRRIPVWKVIDSVKYRKLQSKCAMKSAIREQSCRWDVNATKIAWDGATALATRHHHVYFYYFGGAEEMKIYQNLYLMGLSLGRSSKLFKILRYSCALGDQEATGSYLVG